MADEVAGVTILPGGVTRVQAEPADRPAFKPETVPQVPAGVPEKFVKDGKVDYDSLIKSYGELEKKVGGGGAEPVKVEANAETKTTAAAAETAPIAVPGVAPEQMSNYTKEFTEKGELSKDSYDALAKAGYPKEIVDAYVEGQKAIVANAKSSAEAMGERVAQSVGGKESYGKVIAWAADNLSQAEIDGFNNVVSGGNEQAISLAVQGLNSKYVEANGKQGKFVQGRTAASVGDVFNSSEEMRVAMSDKRYKTDPAYRAAVAAKLDRSHNITR